MIIKKDGLNFSFHDEPVGGTKKLDFLDLISLKGEIEESTMLAWRLGN